MESLVLTTGGPARRPVAVALTILKIYSSQAGQFNKMLAGGILASIPPVLMYVVAQRYVAMGFRQMGSLHK
jgi:ABC-type glycerol-3-phosphate transport system permease component